MTTAQQVAEVLSDGQKWTWDVKELEALVPLRDAQVQIQQDCLPCWQTVNTQSTICTLDAICIATGARRVGDNLPPSELAYLWPDGSAINDNIPIGWDVVHPDCEALHCWERGGKCHCGTSREMSDRDTQGK